jgi:hypothetical protein
MMNSAGLDSLISDVVDLSGPEGWDMGVGCAKEDEEFGTGSSTIYGTSGDYIDKVCTECGVPGGQCLPEATATDTKAEVQVKHRQVFLVDKVHGKLQTPAPEPFVRDDII